MKRSFCAPAAVLLLPLLLLLLLAPPGTNAQIGHPGHMDHCLDVLPICHPFEQMRAALVAEGYMAPECVVEGSSACGQGHSPLDFSGCQPPIVRHDGDFEFKWYMCPDANRTLPAAVSGKIFRVTEKVFDNVTWYGHCTYAYAQGAPCDTDRQPCTPEACNYFGGCTNILGAQGTRSDVRDGNIDAQGACPALEVAAAVLDEDLPADCLEITAGESPGSKCNAILFPGSFDCGPIGDRANYNVSWYRCPADPSLPLEKVLWTRTTTNNRNDPVHAMCSYSPKPDCEPATPCDAKFSAWMTPCATDEEVIVQPKRSWYPTLGGASRIAFRPFAGNTTTEGGTWAFGTGRVRRTDYSSSGLSVCASLEKSRPGGGSTVLGGMQVTGNSSTGVVIITGFIKLTMHFMVDDWAPLVAWKGSKCAYETNPAHFISECTHISTAVIGTDQDAVMGKKKCPGDATCRPWIGPHTDTTFTYFRMVARPRTPTRRPVAALLVGMHATLGQDLPCQ